MTLKADLSGKVALVTGATGALGGHIARLLGASGARVMVTGRRLDALRTLTDEIGDNARAAALDVTDDASVDAAFAAAEAAFGPVDILINNAGIAGRGARALDLSPHEFAGVLDVDLTGAFRVARTCAVRLVAPGKPGSIVNIASLLGLRVGPGVAAYAAAKAGLIHLTEALALEWARHTIRVNALAPGYILTDLNRDFLAGAAGEAMTRRIPQRRLGEPADLDGAVLLLASEASRYMTGSVVVVDGGHCISSL